MSGLSRHTRMWIGLSLLVSLGLLLLRNTADRRGKPLPPELYQDDKFRSAVALSLGMLAAEASMHVAASYHSPSFHKVGRNIESRLLGSRDVGSKQRREANPASDPLSALTGLLGAGGAAPAPAPSAGATPATPAAADPLGGIGALLGGLTGGNGSIFDDLLNGIVGDLQGPALFLGAGLGSGATTGLNLSSPEQAKAVVAGIAAANKMDPGGVNGVALNLGSGLASAAVPLVAANLSDVTLNLSSTLEAAGAGLGQGAAEGLGIGKLNEPIAAAPPMSPDSVVPSAVYSLTKGLSSSFLQTANLSALMSKVAGSIPGTPGGPLPSVPRLAEGFARGLIDGAVSGASTAGGVSNIIKGNVSMAVLSQPATQPMATKFDDSVSGASVAFGRGLANEGVLLAGALLGQQRRRVRRDAASGTTDVILPRQALPPTSEPIINSTFLGFLVQQGVNTFQCDGVGGLAAILLGLMKSNTITLNQLSSFKLDDSTASLLPSESSTVKLDGNTLQFNTRNLKSAKINGLSVVPFAVLLVFHVLLAIMAFFVALPLFLILNATQRITASLDKPIDPVRSQRLQKRIFFFFFLPLAIISTIFGIAGKGNAAHFRSPHGVVGLLTFILATAAGILYFLRSRDPRPFDAGQLFPLRASITLFNAALLTVLQALLAPLALITAFDDLRSSTFCIAQAALGLPLAVAAGTGTAAVPTAANALVALRWWLERRRRAKVDTGSRNGGESIVDTEAGGGGAAKEGGGRAWRARPNRRAGGIFDAINVFSAGRRGRTGR